MSDPVTVESLHSVREWAGLYAVGVRILSHPNPTRLDQSALLFDEHRAGTAQISRHEPVFRRADGTEHGPLASLRVSRRPVHLAYTEAGTLTIWSDDDAEHVFVDERPLHGPLQLSAARIQAGVLLRLGKHVLLWLGPVATSPEPYVFDGLLGDSRAMRELRRELLSIANLPVSVLLRGEPGSGKETSARALHAASDRAGGPFVAVNVAAVAPEGAARALFGQRGGQRGFFAEAAGGTIFLDQLLSAPAELQVLLVRALAGDAIQPVGGGLEHSDARIVASVESNATSGERSVTSGEHGLLRSSLARRFGYELAVPSLRDRRSDAGGLFYAFLRAELVGLGDQARFDAGSLSDDTPAFVPADFVASLVLRPWPGNLDELRRAALRYAVYNHGRERPSAPLDLAERESDAERGSRASIERRVSVAELSDLDIEAALARNAYVVDATAEDLGVSRSWLHTHLNESPNFRKAKDLTSEEIERALAEHEGDLTAVALALRVSRRGLQLQMSRFGIRHKAAS